MEAGERTLDEYRHAYAAAFDRSRCTGRPAYLRRELRQGWRAKLPVYVLWCEDCGIHTVTHPAGYGRIHCRGCRRHEKVLTWVRFRDKQAPLMLYLLAAALLVLSWLFAR
ncbi:MAG TPA: hypothetical protein VL426_05510 [Candidatus Binatia bacterium]|jgi:hypothetical protein|nr:hypothetical protein [Candidatus Binatia bacterium]